MSDAVFRREGDAFVPTGHARGPWDPGALHGGGPSALVARAVEALAPDMALTRLTIEFVGTVPMAPLTVGAELVRRGRRLQQAEATVSAGGRDVMRARASLFRRTRLPDLPPGDAGPPLDATPDDAAPQAFPGTGEAFGATAMELRFARGSWAPGPSQCWFRPRMPFVAGEDATPVQRAAAAGDFGNGISGLLDWGEWLYINTDLTVALFRPPAGEWIGLDAHTILDPGGAGLAASVLHDAHGPVGRAQQTLMVERR